MHLASLFAVLIFTRKEIFELLSFKREHRRMWLFLIVGTIPAAVFGYLFSNLIENSLSSFLFLGISFFFTGFILLGTKFIPQSRKGLSFGKSLGIGLMQVFALFPGVSRSGMTISTGLFFGVERESAVKFSFLLFIPLALGAMILEFGSAYFSWSLVLAFLICFFLSLIFLKLLLKIIQKNYFWIFSIYCFFVGCVSLILYFF